MKHIKFIVLFNILFFSSFICYANKEVEMKAEKYYAEKNYKEAILAYESILKEGFSSYKLHYNLGNAYYKNKEIGKAIFNYELANKIQPNNQDIHTNLQIARDKTIDKIENKENIFIGALKSGLINSLSTDAWAWLSIFSLVSCLGFAYLFYATSQMVLKRIGFFAGSLFLIVFISSMLLGYTALNEKKSITYAIILAREIKIYEEPVITSNSKFSLHEGTKVKVLESNSDWTSIKLENGNEGWSKTNDLGLF